MRLKNLPYEDLGYAADYHRKLRSGFVETVFSPVNRMRICWKFIRNFMREADGEARPGFREPGWSW